MKKQLNYRQIVMDILDSWTFERGVDAWRDAFLHFSSEYTREDYNLPLRWGCYAGDPIDGMEWATPIIVAHPNDYDKGELLECINNGIEWLKNNKHKWE